jgi:hypothetical protein
MVRVVRIGYWGIRWRIKWVQRIKCIIRISWCGKSYYVILAVPTSSDDLFDN